MLKMSNFVLKNALIWSFLLAFASTPVILLKLWKLFVSTCARLLRPNLKPFETRDIMTVADDLYRKPLSNIGFVLKLNGKIRIEDFRQLFYSKLLEPVDSFGGKRLNANLLQCYKKVWGYPFKHELKLRDIDLPDLIYETTLKDGESFSDFVNRFFYFPYEVGKPLWNVAVLQNADVAGDGQTEGSTVLFRLHHCLGDGYSLLHLFEQLAENNQGKATVNGAFRKINCWKTIHIWFTAPLTLYQFGKRLIKIPNPFGMSGVNTEILHAFFTLDLESVKRIRKRTGVHVTSILLTLLGSVLRAVLLEQGRENELPEYIAMAHSLPWPEHPKNKMCNEWTLGIFQIQIKNPNVLERLQKTEEDYVTFHNSEINKMVKLVLMPLTALVPVGLRLKSAEAGTPVATSWATLVAGKNYRLLKHEVLNIWPYVGFTYSRMAVITVSLSHSNKMDVTLGINRELVSEPSAVQRISNELFPKALQTLVSLSENTN